MIEALHAGSGKAPGHDGITKQCLLLLLEGEVSKDPNACIKPSEMFQFFSAGLINVWYRDGGCPDWCNLGIILPIPKPKDPGNLSYGDKRPLTMLSEFAKLPMKILATRLGEIFRCHPHLLHPAQNGFLPEGNCDDLIRFTLDRILQAKKQNLPLYTMALDLANAYDSCQHWWAELTMLRFGWPQQLIDFVMNYLKSARSCVRCAYGLTEPFKLLNSVRQGDPLSLLLFIMMMDALHCFLQSTPLSKRCGIEWKSLNHQFSTASAGYADDTMMFSSTYSGMMEILHRTRIFLSAHGMRLNESKTEARFTNIPNDDQLALTEPFWGNISWKPADVDFRYLGIWIRLDLDPRPHLKRVERTLWMYLRRLKHSRLPMWAAAMTVREVVWATLDWTSKFYSLPAQFSNLYQTIRASAN